MTDTVQPMTAARLEEIRAQMVDAKNSHSLMVMAPADLAALLGEVERLRAALEQIAEEHDAGRHDGLPEPCPAHDADVMFALARAALGEDSGHGG